MSRLVKSLIVDDEEFIRLNLRALLEDDGCAVSRFEVNDSLKIRRLWSRPTP